MIMGIAQGGQNTFQFAKKCSNRIEFESNLVNRIRFVFTIISRNSYSFLLKTWIKRWKMNRIIYIRIRFVPKISRLIRFEYDSSPKSSIFATLILLEFYYLKKKSTRVNSSSNFLKKKFCSRIKFFFIGKKNKKLL